MPLAVVEAVVAEFPLRLAFRPEEREVDGELLRLEAEEHAHGLNPRSVTGYLCNLAVDGRGTLNFEH